MFAVKWHRYRWIILGLLATGGALAWWLLAPAQDLPAGIVGGNGRIEAKEIGIATRVPGKVEAVLVDEGDYVVAGQIVATVDTAPLKAQKAEAEAAVQAALEAVASARAQVAQRQSDRAAAQAGVRQAEASRTAALQRLDRTRALAGRGFISLQTRDDDEARFAAAHAGVEAARAQLAALDAAVATTRAQVAGAEASVEAARATIRRLDVDIADAALKAPRAGRVQYRIVEPGEVVGSGTRVIDLVDLADVTLTFFLPEASAGKVRLGSEVRVVLDALPDRVLPAKVSFVADVAQFTPKTVETKSEREKLMFRVKARLDPELVRREPDLVKLGVPGMAYLRVDPQVEWPARLALPSPK